MNDAHVTFIGLVVGLGANIAFAMRAIVFKRINAEMPSPLPPLVAFHYANLFGAIVLSPVLAYNLYAAYTYAANNIGDAFALSAPYNLILTNMAGFVLYVACCDAGEQAPHCTSNPLPQLNGLPKACCGLG